MLAQGGRDGCSAPLPKKKEDTVGVDVHERAAKAGSTDCHPGIVATWRNRNKGAPAQNESRSAKITAWRKRKARESDYVRRYLGG